MDKLIEWKILLGDYHGRELRVVRTQGGEWHATDGERVVPVTRGGEIERRVRQVFQRQGEGPGEPESGASSNA